jgi:hypothetical protein
MSLYDYDDEPLLEDLLKEQYYRIADFVSPDPE